MTAGGLPCADARQAVKVRGAEGPHPARMSFAGALRSEAVRLRRSPLVLMHGALAAALGGLAGAYFATSSWDTLLGADAFFQLLGAGAPLLAGISCGLAADAERAAGGCANLLGVPSRRRALAAKAAALLALGLLAAIVAAAIFCAALAVAGRPAPSLAALAAAVLGIGAGSACLYLVFLYVALRFGRNASIGLGALGLIVAMASLGGLANGLVTGTLSGGLGAAAAAFVPFAWPSRLATLPIELSIVGGAGAEAAALASAYAGIAAACAVATLAIAALALAAANRFEGGRGGA